jgi:hypothetical protein
MNTPEAMKKLSMALIVKADCLCDSIVCPQYVLACLQGERCKQVVCKFKRAQTWRFHIVHHNA